MKRKNDAVPARHESWMTTDAEERAKRKARATEEPMRVRAVDAPDGFGTYEVAHPDEDRRTTAYHVEIRDLDAPVNTCDCPDFAKSGLGTCKHVERALKAAAKRAGGNRRSLCGEVFLCRDPYAPKFVAGPAMASEARRALTRLCTADGFLRDASAAGIDAFLRTCDRLDEITPGAVRVSAEVRRHAEDLVRREALARAVGEFKDEQGDDGRWPFLKHPLYPYQREGALHLAGKGRALLADEMGLGKTVQAVAAALLLREVSGLKRALVVVPASLKGEWEEQIRFFSDAPFESLYGMRETRLERYARTSAFFVIANYEQVIRDWKEINDRLRPDLVILDEAQRIKNWKTKTARNLKRLSAPHAFVLTGTPLENRIEELYSLVEFVDPRLFGSLFRFNRRFFAFDEDGHNEGLCNLDELHAATAKVLLRRRKSAVEDELPGRMTKTYKTGMSPEQSRRYSEHFRNVAELYALSKRRPLTPHEQEQLQIELGMMRMLCDSCYILDQKIRDSPKLDEFETVLDDLFADDPTRKIIVFSEWTRMLDLLRERLDAKGIGYALHTGLVPQKRRREEIRRFKEDPDCRLFLASESGGVGLNLQVASVVANLDMPWNPAKLEQRIARAWRKHQKRDVLVVNMVAENTIEEKMLQTLSFKQGLADYVLDALGDARDFEFQNRAETAGKKKPSAFMQRLASVMGGAVKVETTASKAKIPPDERLRASAAAAWPGAERLLVASDEPGADRAPTAAVVVGRGIRRADVVSQLVATHGVALPEESVEVLPPEAWQLLERLRALGVISFTNGFRSVLAREAPDAAAVERAKRRTATEKAFADVARRFDMGELLLKGGFVAEGLHALRDAAALAAGAALFAAGSGPADASVAPVTLENLVMATSALRLPPPDALTLQLAAQGLDIPDAASSVRRLVDRCRSQTAVAQG